MENRPFNFMLLLSVALTLSLFTFVYSDVEQPPRFRVGLLVTATGRYIEFIPKLLQSARRHFCTDHDVTFFIFTDRVIPHADDVVLIPHQIYGWPYDSMWRSRVYAANEELLTSPNSAYRMDYLFACDADMLFVGTVGSEILSDRVATQFPAFVGRMGTPETRPISTAYLDPHIMRPYFAGGFYGGTAENVMYMARTMTENMQIDLERGFIAIHNDESHLNRYFADNPPTLILNPSYCFPDNPHYQKLWGIAHLPAKLLALTKDHNAFRVQPSAVKR